MCFASVSPYEVTKRIGRIPGFRLSEESKKLISEKGKGRIPWNKGKPVSPEMRQQLINARKLQAGEKHPMFGKHHTKKANLKNSLAHRGLKQSPEHIKKKVDMRAGYQHSEETKRQIRETNLKTWSIPEVRNQSVGENSATWKNGISFVPYPIEFNTILKERIRNRDGRKCRECGKTEEENEQRLDIHHIDHDKNNLTDGNLLSLCILCHRKAFNINLGRNFGSSPITKGAVTLL